MKTSRSPTLQEVIQTAIESRLSEVRVALPGRIEKYDAARQAADVKPLIQRRITTAEGGEILESLPVIPDVPVVFPRAGDFFISLPISVGDRVLLVFNDKSIDKFVTGKGEDTDPVDVRNQALSDAVALPGFHPFGEALTSTSSSDIVIGKEGGAQDFVALAAKVFTELAAIKSAITGAVVVAGDGGASLKTTILAALASFPGSVAAQNVKVT